jgi:hypothetical protein
MGVPALEYRRPKKILSPMEYHKCIFILRSKGQRTGRLVARGSGLDVRHQGRSGRQMTLRTVGSKRWQGVFAHGAHRAAAEHQIACRRTHIWGAGKGAPFLVDWYRRNSKWVFTLDRWLETVFNILQSILGLSGRTKHEIALGSSKI